MKKQSEWMKGLLAAEDMVMLHGVEYTRNNIRWLIMQDGLTSRTFFYEGMCDYLDNYKERNNA
jgi:hypothetical protein